MADTVAPLTSVPLPPPSTNILMLPLIQCQITTGTNEDWIDGFAFFADDAETQPLSLDGIQFEMEMRAFPPDHNVAVRGSSQEGTLQVSGNVMGMNIPASQMTMVPPGDYTFDILAYDGNRYRIIVQGTACVVFQGITR